MTKLARSITRDEISAYKTAGVVLLKGILDLAAVNALRRCIDDAVRTIGESPSGYDLSALTRAIQSLDQTTLEGASGGQHDIAAIAKHIKSTGKPFLQDGATGKGSFILDTGIAARLRDFRRLVVAGAMPMAAPTGYPDDRQCGRRVGTEQRRNVVDVHQWPRHECPIYVRSRHAQSRDVAAGRVFVVAQVTAMAASHALPETEQLALGGLYATRGYRLDDGAVDAGLVIRNELRLPSFAMLGQIENGALVDTVSPFVFFDYGYGRIKGYGVPPLAVPTRNLTLAGTGGGVDYRLGANLNASLVLGYALRDALLTRSRDWNIQGRVTLTY